ncbi:recQ-mediated genome instability protein 2, partial [Huso huso]
KTLRKAGRDSQVCLGPSGKNVYFMKRQVSVVWMQGTVLEVTGDQNTTVQLLDDTGTFIVTGASSVPRGRQVTLKPAVCFVLSCVHGDGIAPVLPSGAVKMADLSEKPLHQSGWRLEVQDLQQTLP